MSNQVLEFEVQSVQAEIEALKRSKKPVPEDLIELKAAYDMKMNLLVSLIQVGSLTMDGYLRQLKESIEETKSAALHFKRAGRLDLAKTALKRVKLMQEEIATAE